MKLSFLVWYPNLTNRIPHKAAMTQNKQETTDIDEPFWKLMNIRGLTYASVILFPEPTKYSLLNLLIA